ncbi:MOSC domain-containing protein [Brevibacillus sp. SYSU BS000544]|uniref:MOSC domain-containing protein n=1 Tax=Brevibacillus sp. SYSU BS000544 TaxID=3416443 RepID=UPI003CE54C7A
MLQGKIISLNVGLPQLLTYEGGEILTGITKAPVQGPIFLSSLNFDGDAQADLQFHGGVDKAICVYPHEHYPYWEQNLNRALGFAAFGENLTVSGLLEKDVCIGDKFQLGEAVVQVSQPRQPCHKLAKKYNVSDLPVRVQDTMFTGYYFRVLQEGNVTTDSDIRLLERDPHGITVEFANQIMHHDKKNRAGAEQILAVEGLSTSWRNTLNKRLEGLEVDTAHRLKGSE